MRVERYTKRDAEVKDMSKLKLKRTSNTKRKKSKVKVERANLKLKNYAKNN